MPSLWDLWKDKRSPEERAALAEERKSKLSRVQAGMQRPIRRNSDGLVIGKRDTKGSKDKDLSDAFSGLAIVDGSPSRPGFVGGFHNRPSISTPPGQSSPANGPLFPVPAVELPTPGPLPCPPQSVNMPTPYSDYTPSMTMLRALQGLNSDNTPPTHLSAGYNGFQPGGTPPAIPHRPVSAPDGTTSSSGRRRLQLGTATPPRINRSTSEPTSPVSARRKKKASSDIGDGDDFETCAGMTKAGKRCTRKVKTTGALDTLNLTTDVPRFCHQHEKVVLQSSTGYYSKKPGEKDKWITFAEWIPEHLQPDTKAALRLEMEKARSNHDVPGYIYAFEIRDLATPKMFHIKVGRAVSLNKRVDQWSKQCGSKEQVLRGFWPGSFEEDADEASLLKGRVDPGERGAFCHRLERLIHIELADVVLHQPHYKSKDDSEGDSTAKSKSARVGKEREPCSDCGAIHKEIFSFERPKRGKFAGKEWDLLVKPVIKRWGTFVELYV